MSEGKTRIHWLDAIRILAIGLIVGFHFLFAFTLDDNIRIWGFYGVSLFFMSSGFALALRYPNITGFDLGWFVRRYIHIASVYYPALIAVVLLFSTQCCDGSPFYILGAHFLFLDWILPGAAFSIVSPAWFVIPLMAFYVLYPFINRFLKPSETSSVISKIFYPLAFIITVAIRLLYGGLISVNPLFFLADFCFGMRFAYEKSYWIFLPAILLAIVNPAMMIPFAVFGLIYLARAYVPSFLSGVAKYTFEIFLFHEGVMNVIIKKWTVYGSSVPVSLLSILVSAVIVVILSEKINGLMRSPAPVTALDPAPAAQSVTATETSEKEGIKPEDEKN